MPGALMGCHRCGTWAPVPDWARPRMFCVACPSCGSQFDVAQVGYRLALDSPAGPAPPPGVAPDTDGS